MFLREASCKTTQKLLFFIIHLDGMLTIEGKTFSKQDDVYGVLCVFIHNPKNVAAIIL